MYQGALPLGFQTTIRGTPPAPPLKELLKKFLKNPQNFKHIYNNFLKFLRFQRTFFKKFFGGVVGVKPLC